MTYSVEQFGIETSGGWQAWVVLLTTNDRQEALLRAGLLATTTPTRAHRVMSNEGVEAFHARRS